MQAIIKSGTLVWCVGFLPSGVASVLAMDNGVLPGMVTHGSANKKGNEQYKKFKKSTMKPKQYRLYKYCATILCVYK